METGYNRRYLFYLFIFLGALSAFPPLVTDMYLPALPAMVKDFNASPSAIQMGLAMCIVGLAVGQLLFGPLSDKYGRRPVIGTSLVMFCIATLVCILSTTIECFTICRFFQGLAGAGGVVLSRSIATDCYSGRDLAKTLAIIGAINGIAPVTAPVIGGLFAGVIGWKGIFWILFSIGVILTFMYLPFKESHPKEKHYVGNFWNLMKQSVTLLKKPSYMLFVLIYGLSMGVLFGYISSAAFIIQNDFGVSELMFGIIFAVNSLGIALGSMLSLKFKNLIFAIRAGATGMLTCAIAMLICYYLNAGFWGYEIFAFLNLFSLGFVFPSSTTMAMTEGKSMIGWASAIVGATGFLFGGIMTPLVGLGTIQLSTYTVLIICSTLAVLLSLKKPNFDTPTP